MELKEIRKRLIGEHNSAFSEFFATLSGFKSRVSNSARFWQEMDSIDQSTVVHNLKWLKDWSLSEDKITELCCTLRTQSAKLKFRSDFIVVIGALLSLWTFSFFPEQKLAIAVVMSAALVERFYVLQKCYENEVIHEVLKSKV